MKARVTETDCGIQGEFNVAVYDELQRNLRDKGFMETDELIKSGIKNGLVLEVGPGPGYLGLEWLKKTQETRLKGLDISPDMVNLARKNARDYGMESRTDYIVSPGDSMPFEDQSFDAVFTNGSLHEWANPEQTMNEIWRVLKSGGRVFISDFKRDMNFLIRWVLWFTAKPKAIRPGLLTSINAAYTRDELAGLIRKTRMSNCSISSNCIGLTVAGIKRT
ncbi:MAG: class I SAM-dependent methyltransferase [Candidatus Delongbacteria bacterium]|nr:class I SAM-dependent methyltransferase [Candidatus Delongbacteria bacterium]